MPGQYKRKDRFYKKAKDEHYASRAIYKLQELDREFQLFKPGTHVLDLGCAPGSWLQWISQKIGINGRVIGVDLLPIHIPSPPNATVIEGDFTNPSVIEHIRALNSGAAFDTVVSDSSPNLSGILFADQERSLDLNRQVIEIARLFLRPGGKLVLKSFEGERMPELKKLLSDGFVHIKRHIPEATRKTSREVYWIAERE